jgi:uncharacterized protein (TIGR02466 family)
MAHCQGYSMDFQVIPLFPKAVLYLNIGRKISDKEIKTIKKLDYIKNEFNLSSKNTHILDLPELEGLKTFFQNALDCYIKEVIKIQEVEVYITQSWVNITTENQSHHRHQHPNSFLSGVFYVEVDSTVDQIVFERDKNAFSLMTKVTEFNLFNSDSWAIGVKNGDLMLFSSDLAHLVPTKKESNKRISISFNTFLKGVVGSERDLNQLQL